MKLPDKANTFLSTLDRSTNTIKTYRQAIKNFYALNGKSADLTIENYTNFLVSIKDMKPSSKGSYKTAILALYGFNRACDPNELREITKHYLRKGKGSLPHFDNQTIDVVDNFVKYCQSLRGDMLSLRDRAFVILAVDTGFRISEACSLSRGQIDWQSKTTPIIGKGDKPAIVHISNRAILALRAYLRERDSTMESSQSLASQPLFARHDMSASKKIKPVKAGGMWKALKGRMEDAGLDTRVHDFRHYFVTRLYREKGIKTAMEGARHSNINTTNRYAHLAEGAYEKAYDEVFNK